MPNRFIIVNNTSIEELKGIFEKLQLHRIPTIDEEIVVDIHNTKNAHQFLITIQPRISCFGYLDFCDVLMKKLIKHNMEAVGWFKKPFVAVSGLPDSQWMRCIRENLGDDYVTIFDEEGYVYEVENVDYRSQRYLRLNTLLLKKTDQKIPNAAFVKPDNQYCSTKCHLILKKDRLWDFPLFLVRKIPFIYKKLNQNITWSFLFVFGLYLIFSMAKTAYGVTLPPTYLNIWVFIIGAIIVTSLFVLPKFLKNKILWRNPYFYGLKYLGRVSTIFFCVFAMIFIPNRYIHSSTKILLIGTVVQNYSTFHGRGGYTYHTIIKPNSDSDIDIHFRTVKKTDCVEGDECMVLCFKGIFGMLSAHGMKSFPKKVSESHKRE